MQGGRSVLLFTGHMRAGMMHACAVALIFTSAPCLAAKYAAVSPAAPPPATRTEGRVVHALQEIARRAYKLRGVS